MAGTKDKIRALLGGDDPNLMGVDISSSAVKLLELSKRGERMTVEAYAVEPLPTGAVNDKQVVDVPAVASAIERAVARAKPSTKQVAIAVGGAAVISKIVQMPTDMSEDERDEQIRADAAQYIPYPIEDVSLDFNVLGPVKGDPTVSEVLLAACRREQVEGRCAAVEAAQLKPKIVDVEIYAIENACHFLHHQMPDQGKNKVVAVVDIGATTSTMAVLHDLHLAYHRDQAFGGRQLTEDVMRHHAFTLEEALQRQRGWGAGETEDKELIDRFVADLAQQIDRSLQFFFAASHHGQVDQLLLCGGTANLPRLDRLIQDQLQIPTAIAKPFGQMSVSARARPQLLAKDDKSLLVALGLASRTFG